jgi:hypothetical protein
MEANLLQLMDLIRDTDIKIVTVSGKLVREFSSPGGRTAFWDGRDDNGDLVTAEFILLLLLIKKVIVLKQVKLQY